MKGLEFTASINDAQFNKTLDEIEKKIKGLNSGGSVISTIVETHDAIQAITEVANAIVKVRGEFRTWEGEMTGILKSRAEANVLMADVITMAGQSPLKVEEIAKGATELIAFGANAKTAMADLQMLGDVALSVGMPLNVLAELYGKMRESGAASSEELAKLADKNIPVYEELARVLHTNTDGVKTFANEGKISFGQVQQAFMNMTNVGGIFHGVMQKEAETVAGQINALKNAFESMLNEIGQSQNGLLSISVDGLSLLVEHYDKVQKILTVLAATYGTYRAALIAIDVAHKLVKSSNIATLYLEMAKGLGSLTFATKANAVALGIQEMAQKALNAVLRVNPYVAAATAVAALAALVLVLYDNTTSAEKAQELLNKAEEESIKNKQELANKTNDLINIIRSETSSRVEQLAAFENLKSMYPALYKEMDIDTFKKKDAIKAQEDLNKVMDEINLANAEDEYRKLIVTAQTLKEEIDLFAKSGNSSVIVAWLLGKDLKVIEEQIQLTNEKLKEQRELFYQAHTPLEEQVRHYSKIKSEAEKAKQIIEGTLPPFINLKKEADLTQQVINQIKLTNLINDINHAEKQLISLRDRLGNNDFHFAALLGNAIKDNDTNGNIKGFLDLEKMANTENRIKELIASANAAKANLNKSSVDYKQLAELVKRLSATGEKAAPFGSLEYWIEVSRKANELLKKLNPFNKKNEAKIAAQKDKKIEADKKAEEVSNLITPKTFEQTLEEKKKQYQDYYKWVNEIGKASADKEFEELLKSGESYKDYLDKQIADLETKVKDNKGTDEDNENLKKLKSESVKAYQNELDSKKSLYELYAKWEKSYGKEAADEHFKTLKDAGKGFQHYLKEEIAVLEAKIKSKTATAEEKDKLIILKAKIELDTTALDAFKAQVSKMIQDTQSETEKITLLNNEKFVVSAVTDDEDKGAKLKALDQQIDEAQKRRHEELVSFMTALIGSEEERVKIKKKYDDRRAALDAEYTDKQSQGYMQQSELLKTNEEKELADNKAKTVLKSKEFEALTQKIKDASSEETKIVLEAERAKLQIIKKKGGEKSAEYEAQLKAVEEAEKKHIEQSQKNWKSIADTVGALGNALKDAGGATGEIGGLLSGLSGEITNVQKTIQKAFSPEGFKPGLQDFASAVQSVISMISTIMESNKKRAEQEKKFAQERVGYEHQYELALNKNIGEGYKKDDNMFMNDIEAKIKSGAAQYQDAQNKFQEAIGKLNEGKAKVSQKNVIDGQSAGKLIGQGASAGAIVGSLFGPLGTAIGAGVGAIVGGVASLFSKKKKDIYGGLLEQYPQLVKTGADGWKSINVDMAKALLANGQLDDNTKQLVQTALDYGDAVEQSTQQMKEGILELTGKLGDTIRDSLVGAFKSGEDAAAAFSKTVGNVIADMTAKLLFSALFKENFNQLEKEMVDSYGALGDQSIIDDLTRFNKNIEGKPEEYVKGLEAANEMFEQMGFTDPFGRSTGGNPNSLSGSIKSISEESAGVLAGQMNAIRMTQASNLDVNRNQLLALTEIATNSRFLKHLERLESIEKKMGSNNGDIRAGGGY